MNFYKARLALFCFLLVCFIFPKSASATYCDIGSIPIFYKPTLVVATAIEQKADCESHPRLASVTTTFKKLSTINGSSPDQFTILTLNDKTTDICKDYDQKANQDIEYAKLEFNIGKSYILSADINPITKIASRPACSSLVIDEVSGSSDPKIVLVGIKIYILHPILALGVKSIFILIEKTLGMFSGTFEGILSGLIVLILYGFAIFWIFKGVINLVRLIIKHKNSK